MKTTVAIIGVGLIGGSLGQALRKTRRYRVIGIARKPRTLKAAKRLGAIDVGSSDLRAVRDADIVVVCTPVSLIVPTIRKIRPYLKPQAIVTDVGSVKGSIHREVCGVRFVGSHPLAGSHKTGVESARPDLFFHATCVVVPQDRSALPAVKRLWTAVGGKVLTLSSEDHDTLVALTSHLPHLIAHGLVRAAMGSRQQSALKSLMAGSFRDVTRVASADADQWAQIFQDNRPAVRQALTIFLRELKSLGNQLGRPALTPRLIQSQRYRAALFHGI